MSPTASARPLEEARKLAFRHGVPVIVEVILEPITNVSTGNDIDTVSEFGELAVRRSDAPTAAANRLP